MLTNRQLQVLRVIVDDFISTGQPIGSRQISKKEEISFSSATIRNEMADLEDLGFLEKTHTSSGRIPSEKGYRFYVDHLIKPHLISNQEIETIHSVVHNRMSEAEQVIRNSAAILSELTTYTSVILGPDLQMHKVKKFSIVPLSIDSAVAIIVTDSGHVENRVFNLPKGVFSSEIEKIVNILNDRLVGVSMEQLSLKLEREVANVIQQHVGAYEGLLTSIFGGLTTHNEGEVYFGGKMNMFNQPEFHDISKVRMFLDFMDTKSQIHSLLQSPTNGISIRIGSENNHLAMEDLSVITATFAAGDQQQGSIAIIGPKRMDYQRVITLLDYMSGGLSKRLSNK